MDPASVHLPIEPYLVSGPQLRAIDQAQTVLLNRCLAKFGFDPEPAPPAFSSADAVVASLTDRRYGIHDLALAREFGFHSGFTPAFVEAAKEQSQRARTAATLASSPTKREALGLVTLGIDPISGASASGRLYGGRKIPSGGCAAESNRELLNTNAGIGWDPAARQIEVQSLEKAQADPQVQEVLHKWATCMAQRGFQFSDPLSASNHFTGPSVSNRERAAATATVLCDRQTNLIGVWFGVERQVEEQQIESQATALAAAKALLNDRVARAIRLVQGGGGAKP